MPFKRPLAMSVKSRERDFVPITSSRNVARLRQGRPEFPCLICAGVTLNATVRVTAPFFPFSRLTSVSSNSPPPIILYIPARLHSLLLQAVNIDLSSSDDHDHKGEHCSTSSFQPLAGIKIHNVRPLARDTMASQPSTQHVVTTPLSEATLDDRSSQDVHDGAEKPDSSTAGDENFQKQPLTTIVLLATTSLMAMFLIALDRTIIITVRKHGGVYARI
jgi:hypothetical protein